MIGHKKAQELFQMPVEICAAPIGAMVITAAGRSPL
jgi:hypothetical protein